ncbi:MAG: 4-alpha-glucanotransferase [Clostridia bacterium]|nr:4-alpha-glucanotransferase [Clostridia bacterium]
MKRSSGVLMHVSSLWGEYSEGSFGKSAYDFVDFLRDCHFTYWQVLPFCLPDEYNSPYKSYSAFSGNPFFIDLPTLAKEGLLTRDELEGARQNTPYYCEFERLHRERMPLLAKAAGRFDRWSEINDFMALHPEVEAFCRYMALKEANGTGEYASWTTDAFDKDTYRLWLFTQYKFHEQWKKLKNYANANGIKIIGDIPIYVAAESADVWSSPGDFLLNEECKPTAVAGVPPDYFAAEGQLWGNPLYNWDKMKEDGYGWWCRRMKFMNELFDGVRIDHFRGIEAFYSIPAGETTAKNGKWVKGPGMDLINAIKPLCEDKLIIAEDLGDITDEVRELVEESGFPGMGVMQFAFLGDESSPHLPHNYKNNQVAYTGTHDNNTLLGFVWEQSEGERRRLLDYCGFEGSEWDTCYNHLLRTMFASHAGLVILPVQDLLLYGSDTRLNKPGSCDDNWNYRITEEQLHLINRDKFRKWNDLYGRK